MKITTLDTPKTGTKTYFIAGDWHSDHLCTASYSILKQRAQKLPKKKRSLIINGDFLDVPYLMHRQPDFKLWASRANGIEEYFLPKYLEEMHWGNFILDDLKKTFNEIIYIEGNHDDRVRWFSESKFCPSAYKHNFNIATSLQLTKRKILHVKHNDWLDIGDLSITHGMYHGSTCLKKHYEACGGRSVIFSHVHRAECKAFVSRGKTRKAWSLPTMALLNPAYIKNSENNWTNGFGEIVFKPNGHFNVFINEIYDGELCLPNGEVLRETRSKKVQS